MPLTSSQILSHFTSGHKSGRLAHSFLFTASQADAISEVVLSLAEKLIGEPTDSHPDFYRVRPESKSRRITVEQIRTLEKSLYMKPMRAPVKVAWIEDADRMCLGSAEPANAFLKTLEEPPASTFIFLSSTRPQVLLPTIISRCIRLDLLASGDPTPDPQFEAFWKTWSTFTTPGPVRAYQRARLLSEYWASQSELLEDSLTEQFTESDEDGAEILKALIAGEFQLARQQTVAKLQFKYWEGVKSSLEEPNLLKKLQAIRALEDLQQTLQTNMDQNLVVDRACLALEGLV